MASSLEVNKFLAAILTAGVIASGAGVLSRILYHAEVPEEPAYQVAVVEEGGGETAAAAEEVPLPMLLANASAEEGEGVVRACAACHSFEQGGAAKIGPPLWGVVGRDIASVDGFAYSDALLEKEGTWDYEPLNEFLTNPKGWAPGTKMAYAGIKNPEDRADAIVYLHSLSDNPLPLPEAPAESEQVAAAEPEGEGEAAATEGAAAQGASEGEQAAAAQPGEQQAAAEAGSEGEQVVAARPGEEQAGAEGAAAPAAGEGEAAGVTAMLAQADAEAGQKAARVCAACHSFEEGGPNKIGPGLWGVVGRDIASHEGFSYSDALAQKDGAWDYETLDHFLANPREWAPGTKMAYAGLKKPEQRADVIMYLRSLAAEPQPLPEGG